MKVYQKSNENFVDISNDRYLGIGGFKFLYILIELL